MNSMTTRRDFLVRTGISVAAANLVAGLPSLSVAANSETQRKQRLIFVFSPNGVIPKHFWPENLGADFELAVGGQAVHEQRVLVRLLHDLAVAVAALH